MQYEKGSFIVVPNKGRLEGIGGNAQALFMWLCSYANTDGNCFPSIPTLAKKIGISESSIKREIKKLVELGVVTKNQRKEGSVYLSNEYTVVVFEENIGGVKQTLPGVMENFGGSLMSSEVGSQRATNSIQYINSIQLTNIYTAYKEKINSLSRLTDLSKKKIKARLSSFSEKELISAIDAFSKDEWWVKHNSERGIAWFFNSDDRIDQFLSLGKKQIKKIEGKYSNL